MTQGITESGRWPALKLHFHDHAIGSKDSKNPISRNQYGFLQPKPFPPKSPTGSVFEWQLHPPILPTTKMANSMMRFLSGKCGNFKPHEIFSPSNPARGFLQDLHDDGGHGQDPTESGGQGESEDFGLRQQPRRQLPQLGPAWGPEMGPERNGSDLCESSGCNALETTPVSDLHPTRNRRTGELAETGAEIAPDWSDGRNPTCRVPNLKRPWRKVEVPLNSDNFEGETETKKGSKREKGVQTRLQEAVFLGWLKETEGQA